VRWKINYIFIAYFLGNIYAKNCYSQTVYIKIITSYTGGTVFETQCRYFSHVCTQFVQILKLEQESANGKQLNSDQVLCVIYTVNSDWLLCVSECDFHH